MTVTITNTLQSHEKDDQSDKQTERDRPGKHVANWYKYISYIVLCFSVISNVLLTIFITERYNHRKYYFFIPTNWRSVFLPVFEWQQLSGTTDKFAVGRWGVVIGKDRTAPMSEVTAVTFAGVFTCCLMCCSWTANYHPCKNWHEQHTFLRSTT